MIETKKLRPHPQNPRRELGDLQELIASIRESGVLQNLLVVPDPDESGCFRVVIGHRRRAAAIVAGVKEVPCVVSDMGPEEQLGTMMAENVQRSNLTLADTIMGVRSLLDLPGVDEHRAAELTGLSRKYIADRAKIARAVRQADVVKMEAAQATLLDLVNLSRLPEENQQHVIDRAEAGKADLQQLIRMEVEKMDRVAAQKAIAKWAAENGVEMLQGVGELQLEDGFIWQYHSYMPFGANIREKLEELKKAAGGRPYAIVATKGQAYAQGYIKAKVEPTQEPLYKARERRRDEARKKLDLALAGIRERWTAWVLRGMWEMPSNKRMQAFEEYVLTFGDDLGEPKIEEMGPGAAGMMWAQCGLDGEVPEEDARIWAKIWMHFPIYARQAILYTRLLRGTNPKWRNWNGIYDQGKDEEAMRMAMQILGYVETDEDKAVMDGTHEAYVREESE